MEEKRKKRTRVRRKNSGIKKLVLWLVLLFIIIQLFIKVIVPGSVTLSRYVYSAVRSYYLNSKEFYFNSDKLGVETAHFESDNWSGVDEYAVTISMTSRKNINEVSKVDINYNIEYEYGAYKSDGTKYEGDILDFYITGMENINEGDVLSRTIFQTSNNQDSFDFSVKPKTNAGFKNDDYVLVKIKATSTAPYVSTLTGEFKIIIGTLGMSYKIEDAEYEPYCEVIVTNTLDYYIADEVVGDVQPGFPITIAKYLELSEEDKAKCHSMIITMDFDPNVLRLDTTSGVYLTANKDTEVEYEPIIHESEDGTISETYDYVTKIQFKMEAEESKVVKFYKVNASEDYTYPNSNAVAPIVSVIPS